MLGVTTIHAELSCLVQINGHCSPDRIYRYRCYDILIIIDLFEVTELYMYVLKHFLFFGKSVQNHSIGIVSLFESLQSFLEEFEVVFHLFPKSQQQSKLHFMISKPTLLIYVKDIPFTPSSSYF